MKDNAILILDFGSQYTQLLLKKIRKLGVYTELVDFSVSLDEILAFKPKGIIFSGGPSSVNEKQAKLISKKIFELNIPILGICYGMQLISFLFGGKVSKGKKGEYGKAHFLRTKSKSPLFEGIPEKFEVWMSHFDQVSPSEDFDSLGFTSSGTLAAISNEEKFFYGLQFHPEVSHGEYGEKLLENFVIKICNCKKNWQINEDFIAKSIEEISTTVKGKKVVLGLSGGVDSSVAALLIHKAIVDQLHCIFVDTGLLRKYEATKVMKTYSKDFQMNLRLVDAKDQFFLALKGIKDPEEKRKIIGREFVKVFQEEASKIEGVEFLAQGTIYPDVIESSIDKKSSYTIKSHHNVGGLPKELNLKLLEPLRSLFKDEVRILGKKLGLPVSLLNRHPFPGPGLAVRIIGEITLEKVKILQKADHIFIEELCFFGLYEKVAQGFVVLLPIKTVGVMGDERTYQYTAAIRAVETQDFMTAEFVRLPWGFLQKVSSRITDEVEGINRVVYDISAKPPSTIEWE